MKATSTEQRTKQSSQSQKAVLPRNDKRVGLQNDVTVSQLHTKEERKKRRNTQWPMSCGEAWRIGEEQQSQHCPLVHSPSKLEGQRSESYMACDCALCCMPFISNDTLLGVEQDVVDPWSVQIYHHSLAHVVCGLMVRI